MNIPLYTIQHGTLKLEIAILDLDSLYLHEGIIPSLLNKLSVEIVRDRFIKNPIIVDKNSLVVLDGMHRVAALRRLRYKRIPACLVNYEDPSIIVKCWYRTIGKINFPEDAAKIIQKLKLSYSIVDIYKAEENVKSGRAISIQNREKALLIHQGFQSLKEVYDLVSDVESLLREENFEVGYDTESDAKQKLDKGLIEAVIAVPPVDKRSVVNTALAGRVFSHKTTRHIIPARPLSLNIPISWLVGSHFTLGKVNEMMISLLKKKKLKHMPSGSVIEGRRYEEELYIFEQH